MKYIFDPTVYGFLPPKRIPKVLKDYLHKKAFVKVIATAGDAFWYTSCYLIAPGDDRWVFMSGLYDKSGHSAPLVCYSGCITSPEFAEILLVHIFGTTTNEGTLKYGRERLQAASLRIPKIQLTNKHG